MDESSIRPPEVPKPSASSSLSANRLKNRLILGWSRLPTTASDTHESHAIDTEPITLKGFGEDQFDISDGIDGNRSSVLGMQSSMWSENTFTHKLRQQSSIISHHRLAKHSQRPITGKSVNSFGVDSSILKKSQDMLSIGLTSSRTKAASKSTNKESLGRRRHKVRDPTRMPHLSTSILYNEEGGWEEVASSIAFGETEFCYLQPDTSDIYKFSMQSNYSGDRILKNDFATMSKHGVMRSSIITGQSEMVSHDAMMKEQAIYHKLREIKVFRQFRLWKTFYVWYKTVKLEKYRSNANALSESLLLLHPFYRSLVSIVIEHCAYLQSLPVLPLEPLVVYDLKAFTKLQKTATADFKAARDAIVDKLIRILCSQGKNYVYHSLESVPSAISMDKFNSLKISQASTTVSITDHVLGPGTTALVSNMAADSALEAHNSSRGAAAQAGRQQPKLTVSYTERAAIRTNCRKLASLFRLVDFVVRDSLYNSVYLGLLKVQIFVEGYTPRERQLRKMKLSSMRDAAMEVLADMRISKAPPASPNHVSSGASITPPGSSTNSAHTAIEVGAADSSLLAEMEEVQGRARALFRLVVDITAVVERPECAQPVVVATATTAKSAATMLRAAGRQSMLPVGLSIHATGDASAGGAGALSFNRLATTVQQVIKTKYVITFDVTLASVLRTFSEAISNCMRGASYREGLLSLEICSELLTPILSEVDTQPLEDRFAGADTPAHAVLNSCCEVIGIDYERAQAHADLYRYLCDTYLTHLRILENAEVTQLASTPPEEMAEHLELFRASQERCLEVAELQDVGVFRLEFTALKAKILGVINRCRAVFFKIIPELYVTNGDVFYNELSRVIDILEMKHTTIDAYVRLVELFNKTTAETDVWTAKFQYIMAMKDILSAQEEIVKSEAVVRQNLTIVTVWQRFILVMNDFEEAIESKSKHYQSQLKQRVKLLVEPLQKARHYLTATAVLDHNSDADTIVAQLTAYLHEVDVVLKKGKEVEHYQAVLKYHVYSHTQLTDLAEDLQTLLVLWSLVKLIKELQISFMSVNFLDAASSEVEKQLRYAQSTILHKLKDDNINAVQIWLGDALAHLQLVAPVIKKLQAPTQKAAHIQRVHALLGRKIFEEEDVTVGELVDVVDILRHAAALDAIYEESLFEYNLEASAKTLQKKLQAAEFVFDNEKDNISLVFIANFHEIDVFLEDTAISLQACANSKYSAPHLDDLRVSQTSVQSWVECNKQFEAVQEGYLRIRVLFTCARTARYLGASVKHFKVLDEHWRTLIKLARTELRISSVYSCPDIQEDLAAALEAIRLTDADLTTHIREQCMKFPKLYLLDAKYLMEVFATLDPRAVFNKCRQVFPMLSDVIFLPDDAQTSSAVESFGEVVIFRKPCSARSSLVDWLRSIETSMHDKLEVEIREHMHVNRHIMEDLKLSKTCEQSRLVAVQVAFWSQLLRSLQRESHTQAAAIRTQMLECVDQISLFSGLATHHTQHTDSYHLRSMENLLILLISHRDLLNLLLDSSGDVDGSGFILETSIKKLWDSDTAALVVKQGQHKQNYGMKYVGFTHRLAIMPLTDKFFLAVSNVVQSGSMACVFGVEDSGKHHTVTTLAQEFGYDVMPIDCRAITTVESFAQVLRAHLGSGFWGNYCHLCQLPRDLLGVVMTVFSAVHVALAHQDQHIYIADQRLDIIDRQQGRPKFCLLFNSPTAQIGGGNPLPPSVRRQFRPLYFAPPDRKALFSVLLAANNFVMVPKIVTRLDALCAHVVQYRLCPEAVLVKILLKCIPLAKQNYVHPTANATTQMGLFTKLVISHFPWVLQDAITEDDLRYICNLFLEVMFLPTQDLKEFKRVATASVSDCASILYNHVRYGESLSVLVVGAPCTGKSTLIKEISANAVADHNEDIAQASCKLAGAPAVPAVGAGQAQVAPAASAKPARRMQLYKRMLNIFTMADYSPPPPTSEHHHEGLAPAQHSPLVAAAVHALTSVLRSIDTAGVTQVLHLDTQSSLQFAYLHPQAEYLSKYYAVPVKYVWECVELNHVDPATLTNIPMVCVKKKIFELEDVIAYQLKSLSSKTVHQFHGLISECVDMYVRPCLQQRSPDSFLSDCTLAENVFKMILSVCSAGDLLAVAGSVKRWENTVRRVVLLSCIWTVGVCSPTSREPFQEWFATFFRAAMGEQSEEDKIFPTFNMQTTSLFDSSLVCPNDKEVYLEWALFDRITMMEIMDKAPPAAGTNKASYISSEDRLRRSYQDIYYTTLLNQAADKASVLVPTPTGSAWMLLQASLMRTGGVVLVTGAAGSGKSMLMRQMVELSKAVSATRLSQDTAARWVCHVTDCGPAELQRHMEHCKRSVLPLLMERKLPDKGSVMIDDVSLVQHSDNHSTCAEFFRASCEAGELYMSQRNSWLPLQKYYTVLASNNAPGEHNTRLLRHLLVLCCAEVELEAVFEQKLLAHCNVMTPDIANDLSLVTLNLARVCAHMLKQAQGSAEYSTELGMDMKHLTPADKLFLHLNTTMPPSVIADCLLSRVARGLDSMAGTYSSNDVVRVWDRTIADYFVRHPSFAPVLNAAHEHVTNNLDFQYATFSTFMEKEKLLRSQGMDALVSTLYSTEQALSPTLPISYKLNASGFFDTKSGIYPGISCAETVRDLLLKKHGRDIVPTGVSPDSLAFWTDVLALSAEFTAPRMSAQSPVLFLTGNHPALHRKVLTVAAVDVVAKLEVVRLETNTFSATAAVPQKGKRTFVAVDSDVVETERVVVGDKEPTASAVLSTTTTSPQFESQLSLQAAVTATFLEAFLTDPIVLRRLKYRNEQAALEASIKGISVIAAPNPNTLLTTAQLAILAKEVPAELFQIIERAVQKYESIDSSALFSEDSAASDKSDRRMVIWHLNVAKDFCHTPNAWVFLLETLELRSAPMLHVLHSMGAALDPAASRSMRNIVQEYVARQRFAVSLDDCSPRAIEETVRDLGRIPRFSPTISVLPCYETYESCEKDLFHLVGAELAAKLLDHVNRYATACHDKLTSAHKPVLAGAVTSNVYSSASVETILTLFGRMMQCGEDSWARALRKSVLQHAAGSLSEEESATLRAATEVTEIALPSELAHSHGASPNQDESDTAQVAVATAKESLSSHTTDLCDLSILGDAVLCVLHSRYCAVLVDEHAPPHDPTGFATLAEGIHHLGLSTTLPVSVAPSAAVLAVVETLLHKCAESTTTTTTSSEGTAISLDSSAADVAENSRISSLVRTARSLPVTSHLRDLLAAICVSMLTDQPIHLVDHSFLTVLALVDLLGLNVTSMSAETLWTNSHFLTLNLYPPYGDSAREENHIPGAIKSENISLRRLQSHSAPPPSKHAVSIVLPAHTMVMSDLLLLRLLQTDGTFCSSDTLRGNWHSHDTGGADKPGELEMTAQQYSQQWDGVLQSMHKPVHALSALMQALVTIPSTQGLVFLGVWSEYKLLLSHAGAGATAAGPVSDAGDRLKTSSAGVILSRSVQSLLTWLPNMLTDWELHAVLLSALLSLHLDTATASGQIMAQRVLQSMRVARHECIGIVPINDSDEAESDAGSESSSSVGAVSLHERSDEDVSDAEDTSDNFRLSENTLAVLKQSLLLIAQALESFAKTHGVKVTVRASSVLVQVAESSLSIVSELRKNIEDWVLWVLDIDDLQMPYKGAYTPNWLDRLAVAMAVKPIIVLPTLLAAIADIGMEVDEEVVSAAASHHQQPPGHERSTEHTSASSAAPGNAHTARAGENQAVVVFSGDSCAKDALSELEHGGTATTLENFTHEFKSESKQQFAKHYAARTHSVYSGSGEVATARVNAATTQSNQVELALRSALQAQEVDGRVHYFVAVDESLTVVSGDGGAGGGVCKYSASCLAELIRDKSNRAGLPSHRQNVRELHHAVLLQDDSADHCHFALQCTPAVDIPAKPLEVVAVEVLNQQCILLPHEESHSTALTLRLPVMLGRPCTKQYVELLQYCYFMVASVPINCPAPLVQIVNRVRWLLVLFHVSLQCKLAAMVTTTSSTSSIAMDTLLQALVSVDTVLTRAYHYTPNEEFLRPAEKVVFTHSEASSHGASTVASRRSSSVNTVQNTAATNTAAATEKPDRAHRNGVRHFRAVAWTLDMLSVEIVDCLYAQLVSSFRLKDIIRSVYLCYFTPGSMNPAAEYLIKGKVVLPHDLSRGAADRFFRDLRTYCDEESSFVELSDSTNGEASAATLKALWYGVDHIIDVYNNAHEARASKLVMHPRNVRLNLQALYRDDTMSRVRRNLQRILDHLPSIIDLTTPEITAQMNDHKKNIGGKTASASGSSASASGNAPGGSGHRPTAPPVAAAATVSDYSARRRRGERIMITFDTREFDPLWAFLLAEATAFNRMLTELRRNIEDLLTCTVDISLLQYFTQCGIAITEGSSDAARIATILQALHDGNAPSTLTSVAFSAREAVHGLKLEDWWKEISDQQHLLMEWLSSGHPPKIRMHLLRNPAGLLYALKETFCMRTDATLDKVHFFYRVQAEESAAQVDVQTISKTNNGCSVILSDLYLHNALFHEKSSMLEFLPEHSASAFGKKLAVLVTVTKEPRALNPEEYMCPIYVHCILPAAPELFPISRAGGCTISSDAAHVHKDAALMHIPMETTEDVDDCRMFSIAVHSGHRITQPE